MNDALGFSSTTFALGAGIFFHRFTLGLYAIAILLACGSMLVLAVRDGD